MARSAARRFPALIRRPGTRWQAGGGGGGPAPFDPLDLSPIRLLEADSTWIATDGGGDVTTWTDQSTAARDYSGVSGIPTYIASDAAFDGEGSVDFTAASSESLREATTPSDIKILHDGTGGTFIAVVDTDGVGTLQTLFQTLASATAANTGFFVRYTATGWRVFVGNSSGVFVSDITAAITPGSKGILTWRMNSGESPAVDLRWQGASIGTGAITGTPASGDSTGTPRLGANSTPAQGFDGRVAAFGVFPWLDASQVTALEGYFAAKYGL